jgi:hypothetical protein
MVCEVVVYGQVWFIQMDVFVVSGAQAGCVLS